MKKVKKNLLTNLALNIFLILYVIANITLVFGIEIDTYAFITVDPNPIGVGQSVSVIFWIQPSPTTAGIQTGTWQGIMIQVTKPDGSIETIGPLQTNAAGVGCIVYAPVMVGSHTFQMNFPGITSETGDYYKSAVSNIENLIVQEDPVALPPGYRPCQLPSIESGNWPMFRHDPEHTGVSISTRPTDEELWTFQTDGIVFSSPAVEYEKVFVGSDDGNIYSLNFNDGTKIWNYQTGEIVRSSPAVKDDLLFVGSDNGKIYCLNAQTGEALSIYQTGGGNIRSSPVITENRVIVASNDGILYGFQFSAELSLIWSFTFENPFGVGFWDYSSPAVSDGMVFMASNGLLYCFDELTGNVLWSYTIEGSRFSSPAVHDSVVYIGSDSNYVYAFDFSGSGESWSYTTNGPVFSSPAIFNDMVFVGSDDGLIHAIDSETGSQIWSYPTGGAVRSSPAVADGLVIVGSNDQNVHAIESTSGNPVWTYPTVGQIFSSLAVVNGVAFVGSDGGKIYAIGSLGHNPPFAYANGPYLGAEGMAITFDGSASFDPDGDVLQYRWDFDNDGIWDTAYSTGPTASNIWYDDYEGIVRLNVYDGEFNEIVTAEVKVFNVEPTPDGGQDLTVMEGELFPIDISIFDPGSFDTHFTSVTYDGGPNNGGCGGVSGSNVPPILVVNDIQYGSVTLNMTLHTNDYIVNDIHLEALNGTLVSGEYEGNTIALSSPIFDYSMSDIPAHSTRDFEITMEPQTVLCNGAEFELWRLQWHITKDGIILSFGIFSNQCPGLILPPPYKRPPDDCLLDLHTLNITVTDDDGGIGFDIVNINVINEIPVVDVGIDQTVTAGNTVNFNGSFLDPGWLDTHVVAWDFGDGETAENTLTPTHTYASSGTYTVKLLVTDDDGGVGFDTLTVTVNENNTLMIIIIGIGIIVGIAILVYYLTRRG